MRKVNLIGFLIFLQRILSLIQIVLNIEIFVIIANINRSQKTTQEKASRIELV